MFRIPSSQVPNHLRDYFKAAPAVPAKSLLGIPWRYAIRCIDELGLTLRAEVIWSKPNGLPESVTDRVRRSHEQWFHFTLRPRYYSAVDEIREEHIGGQAGLAATFKREHASRLAAIPGNTTQHRADRPDGDAANPLGKLPGSVWTIATEPLRVPDHLGVDHFAAFPTEWPRRIIQGWSPREVCTVCGEGRRPVSTRRSVPDVQGRLGVPIAVRDVPPGTSPRRNVFASTVHEVTGYACACPDTSAPVIPGVVLDPFGGTGTVALVADILGRHGISVDLSADYCRLAQWRTSDPKQRAKAARVDPAPEVPEPQDALDFGEAVG